MSNPILLFDGACNLCNGTVQFVIKRDPTGKFRFASLQSDFGQDFLRKNNLKMTDFDSVILVENDQFYTKSDAVLRGVKFMGSAWWLMQIFYIVPRFIRNAVYDIVARNRYKWFGAPTECWIPTPDLRARFL
jgi:predicted DCC family thiol-disulfide oxidoreductase YuxK